MTSIDRPAGADPAADLVVRRARPDDRAAMVALAGAALGWSPTDPNAELFAWKHDRSPFGPSPAWVAELDGELVGVRVLLRWTFVAPGDRRVHAVRAVDTATAPGHRGLGIFRRLTMAAVDELTAEGTDIVFNTPNDQSRPGYLKMGWEVLGRVPVGVAVRRPSGVVAMARARVPAAKWSTPTAVGDDASVVLGPDAAPADRAALARALGAHPGPVDGALLATERTPALFAWRYADGPLQYRVLRRGRHLDDGFAVFRLRRRGSALEATVCDVVHPDHDPRVHHQLVRAVLAETGASYAISVQRRPLGPGASVLLPGSGPVLTWRPLARTAVAPLAQWDLRLGDIELF